VCLSSCTTEETLYSLADLSTILLTGRSTLIQDWTYTCINWLRTLPYIRAWAEKYKDKGVVVIGVHTPEFPFEHDLDNVRRAAKDMKVEYPLVMLILAHIATRGMHLEAADHLGVSGGFEVLVEEGQGADVEELHLDPLGREFLGGAQ
jgi:thiol-disulfide isomerase/thioredoxin